MMATELYDAIKTLFDAQTSTLISPSGVFVELYAGEPPDPSAVPDGSLPLCVMEDAVENLELDFFGKAKMHTDEFAFHIIDTTKELVRSHMRLVDAVFNTSPVPSLGLTNLKVHKFRKTGAAFEPVATDRWECVVTYEVGYTLTRT